MMPFEYSIFSDICEEWNNDMLNNNQNGLAIQNNNGQQELINSQVAQMNNQMGLVLPSPSTANGSPIIPAEDSEIKKKIRRSNQNLASREYRKRKRERLEELEEMVKNLTQQVHDLTIENMKLKSRDIGDLLMNDAQANESFDEIHKILEDIRTTLSTGEGSPTFDPSDTSELDTSLLCMLQLFWFSVEKKQSFVVNEIDKMVNPALQAKLAVLGYSPGSLATSMCRLFSMKWFEDFKKEMNFSPELCEQIAKIDEKSRIEEARMLEERILIDREIKDFYHSKIKYQNTNRVTISNNKSPPQIIPNTPMPYGGAPYTNNTLYHNNDNNNNNSTNKNSHTNSKNSTNNNFNQTPSQNQSTSPGSGSSSNNIPTWLQAENIPSHPPIHEILDFTRKLSELKKSFVNHRTYLNRTYMQIFKLLNPRQQAHLILKAYDSGPVRHREALEFTVNVWKSVTNQDPTSFKYVSMLMNGSSSSSSSH